MPSIQTQFKLADLLKTVADGEKQIEIVRQILAEKTAFEPYTAFKRIDRDSLGHVATIDLVDFLRENQVVVTERELRLVLQEQNTQRDDRLTYTEFLNVVLPKTDSVLRQIVTQRESYFVARDEVLCYEVEHALARVFEKEVDLATKTEVLRKDLADRYDFDALNLFKVADVDRIGSLDIDNIFAFLKENGVIVTEVEILALLRRADRDHDGKLSFSEFYNAITTKDPFHKSTVVTSPTRRLASPARRVASPLRNRSSPKLRTTSTYASKTAEKLSNYDYIDYVHTSATKAARSRSPGLTRSNNFARSTVNFARSTVNFAETTPKKVASPFRQSITRRNLEAELNASTLSASRLKTPTRRVASPVRSPSRTTTTSFIREAISPMKGNEEVHLASALNEQITLDKDLENVKVDLAIRRDFNLLDAFKFFDVEGKAFIGRAEIKDSLNELGIFPTYDEISLLLKKFDRNNEGVLRFATFSDILAPKDASYADILNNRVPSYAEGVPLDQIFTDETIYLLKKTLKAVISNVTYSESIRQKLNRRPLFDQYEGFKALDKDQNGYIRGYEFKELLNDHGYFASQKEVNSLIERYDRNQDGKVSYSEFTNEITPKSPQRY